MPDAKYTPGPWNGHRVSPGIIFIGNESKRELARIEWGEDDDSREVHANAALIAAAPELLEACELAFETATNSPTDIAWRRMIDTLRAAIAKAKGEVRA